MSEYDVTNSAPENVLDFEPEAPTPFESVPEAPKTLTERVSEALEEIEVTAQQLLAQLKEANEMVYSGATEATPEMRLCGCAVDGMALCVEQMFKI